LSPSDRADLIVTMCVSLFVVKVQQQPLLKEILLTATSVLEGGPQWVSQRQFDNGMDFGSSLVR
jgi:hypothetical protein